MTGFKKTLLATALIAASGWANAANVLVVLSDTDTLQLKDNKVFHTGFYLNELMQPVKMLIDEGDTVTFATPLGKAPVMDKHSLSSHDFASEQSYETHLNLLKKLQLTDPQHSPVISLSRVEQIGYDHFDALFVPGGHAPMQDLAVSAKMGKLLKAFHSAGKPTALVCHGPAALISSVPNSGAYTQELEQNPATKADGWIYSGYKMTAFTNAEEQGAKGMYSGGELRFNLETALTNAGAVFTPGPKWGSDVVQDRELITGQNPASASELGKVLVANLKKIQ